MSLNIAWGFEEKICSCDFWCVDFWVVTVRGLKDVTFEKDKLYSACQAGKQVGNTHPKKSMMSTSKHFSCCIWTCLDQPHTLVLVKTNMDL